VIGAVDCKGRDWDAIKACVAKLFE
jgi:hypothetical protein